VCSPVDGCRLGLGLGFDGCRFLLGAGLGDARLAIGIGGDLAGGTASGSLPLLGGDHALLSHARDRRLEGLLGQRQPLHADLHHLDAESLFGRRRHALAHGCLIIGDAYRSRIGVDQVRQGEASRHRLER